MAMLSSRSDPYKRVILHLDLDCFYAQVETLRLGVAPEIPLAVQQWNNLIAGNAAEVCHSCLTSLVNYPARDAGVKRHTSVPEALLKCPQLRLVHVPVYSVEALQKDTEDPSAGDDSVIVARPKYHDEMPSYRADGSRLPPNPPAPGTNKACLEPYRHASMAIFRLLREWCAEEAQGSVLEKGGLDEAFLDITEAVEQALIDDFAERYTILRDDVDEAGNDIECNFDDYDWEFIDRELDWTGLGESVKVDEVYNKESKVEFLQMKLGKLRIWKGCQLAKELRAKLRRELKYIASIGVASNKMLAKLVSALHKPDKQTRIVPSQILDFMRTVPFEKIRLMGGKMGQRVLENRGEEEFDDDGNEEEEESRAGEQVMAADLWPLTVAELVDRVGDRQIAAWIYNLIRGRDDSPCTPRSQTKSFMSAKSFRPNIRDWPELYDWCIVLCGELWSRMQEEREQNTRWPGTLSVNYTLSGKSNGKRQWNNTGSSSKSGEFPKSSHPDPLVVKLSDVIDAVIKLLRTEPNLFPMWRLAVSVTNFRPLDAQGRAKITRVDHFFTPAATNDAVFELPPSKASLFEPIPKPTVITEEKKAAPPPKRTKSVLEMLQATSNKPKSEESLQPTPAVVVEKSAKPKAKSITDFFMYKCERCKFTCKKDDQLAIQEHADYHYALDLSRM